jgi:hypothetical protein
LEYPRHNKNYNAVEIGLVDVRASNSILVEFDFDRDGWKISMPSKLTWEIGEEPDPRYKEVAFVPAWATGNDV